MPGDAIFKTDAGRARQADWYARFLAKLAAPVERVSVPTRHGPSHVLVVGDPGKPPLVALHGSLAGSAQLANEVEALLDHFRLVAPDLPGQSALGPAVKLPLKDDSSARWLLEVVDGLKLDRFPLLGVSWGGFIARQTATVAPERVEKLALLVPAGVVHGPLWRGLAKVAAPLALYKIAPSEARLRRLFLALFTTWDDDWAHSFGDAVLDYRMSLNAPPLATDAELRGLTMPTLVLAADGDAYFPGAKLVARVKAHVPNVDAEVLLASKHVPPTTEAFRAWFDDRVMRFLHK